MAKREPPTALKVQGLSTGAAPLVHKTFVDDFTGEVRAMQEPAALRGLPPSGDQLHQLAADKVAQQADVVLQQAGLSPKPPQPLTLTQSVQRAAVFNQLRSSSRGTRR
jgi:hypothetical protein